MTSVLQQQPSQARNSGISSFSIQKDNAYFRWPLMLANSASVPSSRGLALRKVSGASVVRCFSVPCAPHPRMEGSGGLYCTSGVAQWLACWAHNAKVRGSKPRSATFSKPRSTLCSKRERSSARQPSANYHKHMAEIEL